MTSNPHTATQRAKDLALVFQGHLKPDAILAILREEGSTLSDREIIDIIRHINTSSTQATASAVQTQTALNTLSLAMSNFDKSQWQDVRFLAEGGYGHVSVLAPLDRDQGYPIAYKTFKQGFDSIDTVREFATYALLIATGAKFIPQIVGMTFKLGDIGLAMSLATTNLDEYAEMLDEPQRYHILPSIMDMTIAGLGEIHACNIIHGDVKPGNILIYLDRDNFSRAVISDFGLSTSMPNRGMYSDSYRAPEIWNVNVERYDLPVVQDFPTKESDIWALGVSLLEFFRFMIFFPMAEQKAFISDADFPKPKTRTLLYEKLDQTRADTLLKMVAFNPRARYRITEPSVVFPVRNWGWVEGNKTEAGKVVVFVFKFVTYIPACILACDIAFRYLSSEKTNEPKTDKFLKILSTAAYMLASKWSNGERPSYAAASLYVFGKEYKKSNIIGVETIIMEELHGLMYIPGIEKLITACTLLLTVTDDERVITIVRDNVQTDVYKYASSIDEERKEIETSFENKTE